MEAFMVILMVFITGAVLILRTPTGKGWLGETIIKIAIGKNGYDEKKNHYVIHDLIIEVAPGKTSQIDHIVINQNGIFVIETKNYSGRIYGTETQHEWTQVLQYGKIKNRFYNPVKQNATHIYRLEKLLETNLPIYSVVVFIQANIDNVRASNVIPCKNLRFFLKIHTSTSISPEKMKETYQKILEIKENSTVTAQEHIMNIYTMQEKVKYNICPRCNGNLVLRHGKYSDFMGCENFPNCRFRKNIE